MEPISLHSSVEFDLASIAQQPPGGPAVRLMRATVSVILLSFCALSSDLVIGPASAVSVAGQRSQDALIAREVTRSGLGGAPDRRLVLFAPGPQQALVVGHTNHVYFLKGRLLRVTPHQQAFWLTISRPVHGSDLTPEVATNLVAQSEEDVWPRPNPYKKLIDARSILRAENDLPLAQGLDLRWIRLMEEDGKLAAVFESHTHLRGKVIFDDQFNPASITLFPANAQK